MGVTGQHSANDEVALNIQYPLSATSTECYQYTALALPIDIDHHDQDYKGPRLTL